MKNETAEKFESTVRLTLEQLQKLKDQGFRFVLVKGFTTDGRLDYIEPRFLLLVPIKELSDDPAEKEIYEPINSKLLEDWANSPNEGIEILIEIRKI